MYILYVENPLYYHVTTNLFFCFVELVTHEFPDVYIEETQQNTKNTVNTDMPCHCHCNSTNQPFSILQIRKFMNFHSSFIPTSSQNQ